MWYDQKIPRKGIIRHACCEAFHVHKGDRIRVQYHIDCAQQYYVGRVTQYTTICKCSEGLCTQQVSVTYSTAMIVLKEVYLWRESQLGYGCGFLRIVRRYFNTTCNKECHMQYLYTKYVEVAFSNSDSGRYRLLLEISQFQQHIPTWCLGMLQSGIREFLERSVWHSPAWKARDITSTLNHDTLDMKYRCNDGIKYQSQYNPSGLLRMGRDI